MDSPATALDDFDALNIEQMLTEVVYSQSTGVTATYHQPGTPTLDGPSGRMIHNDTKRVVRCYRGSRDKRTDPMPQTTTEQVIVMVSELTDLTPKAGDFVDFGNGDRVRATMVRFGHVGTALVYYILDVTRVGP